MNVMEKVNSATFGYKHAALEDVHGVFIAMLSHLETRQTHISLYLHTLSR